MATLVERRVAADPRFEAGGASLELVPVPASSVATMGARRVHPARLRYSRWWPATRVTLEIERWSAEACEVLLRPGRRVPASEDAYFAAAFALVAAVVSEIECTSLAAAADPRETGGGLRRAS